MDSPIINTISLFSGVGMLDEGLRAGLEFMGVRSRTILFAEREAYPVAVLDSRIEEGSIPSAPIWFGDLCELNARQFRGVVDCIVAGFPCQDLSVAGKRAGLDGKRSGLFFEVVRVAEDSGAWLILLENVAGIASATATVMDPEEGELEERAASRVLGELADLGWNAEWITISASDVGASHGRARWFCLAWKLDNATSARRYGTGQRPTADSEGGECVLGTGFAPVDDTKRPERRTPCAGSAGSQQGHDGGRGKENGCVGIANEVLGDTRLQHIDLQQRRLRPEHQGAGDELADADEQRTLWSGTSGQQRRRDEFAVDVRFMADTSSPTIRRNSGTAPCPESEHGRRCANDDNGTECVCRAVADASDTRPQGREFGRTLHDNRGGAGNS